MLDCRDPAVNERLFFQASLKYANAGLVKTKLVVTLDSVSFQLHK